MSNCFGIDIGGSGVKGAEVNMTTGEFVGERIKIATPQPATPEAVGQTVRELLEQAGWDGPVGITLPSVIQDQVAHTAANIDPSWIGTNTQELFKSFLGEHRDIAVLNDADAAGIAEVRYGHPESSKGSAIFVTFGTGIGSALLTDGTLYPNTEFGHMMIGDQEAEHFASSAAKDREELSYKEWAKRVSIVLSEYEKLLAPELFIAGGGISRKHEKWIPRLTCSTKVVPAVLRNRAGIVGAAMAVTDGIKP